MRGLKVILIAMFMVTIAGGSALAAPKYFQPDRFPAERVQGVQLSKPEAPPAVIPMQDARAPSAILPFTGADLTVFLALGLAAVGGGTLLVRRARIN